MNNGLLDAYGVPLGAPAQGLTLLQTVTPSTPTASANIDFLTAFSSAYDNYLILATGMQPSADAILELEFSVAGVADATAGNYFSSNVNTAPASGIPLITGSVSTAGIGVSLSISVQNVNDTAGAKTFFSSTMFQVDATPTYASKVVGGIYPPTSIISGFRLLWSAGTAKARGKVRVYGYQNL